MQVTAEQEMTYLVHSCLPELDQLEAEFVRDCWLREPRVPLKHFLQSWQLSAGELNDLRKQVLVRLKGLMAQKHINTLSDIV